MREDFFALQQCIVKEHDSQTGQYLDPKSLQPLAPSQAKYLEIRLSNKKREHGSFDTPPANRDMRCKISEMSTL